MTVPADIALLGFRTVAGFQRAWNLGPRLKADGIAGPLTLAAGRLSAVLHRAGDPDLSAHFSAAEAHCRCGGKLPGCQNVLVLRELLQALEAARRWNLNRALPLIDIYRCPTYNASPDVGGAADGMHPYGAAADLPASLGLYPPRVKGWHLFSGLGYGAVSGTVQHVDVRHLSGHNVTHSEVVKPAEWSYAGR